MTVIFGQNGATLYTNDLLKAEQDCWEFERRFTHLWNVIQKIVGKEFTHKGLLDVVDSVRNSIPGFENLFQTMAKLKASKKLHYASNPVFENGQQGGDFAWEFKLDSTSSTEKAVCPASIPFKGKIVRGSETEYEFQVNVMPRFNEAEGRIIFSLSMPGVDMVLDQVREDEYQSFIERIKPLPELLILRNY